MSTADTNFDHVHSHDDRSGERRSRYKSCKSGVWSLPNIALMVLGFIIFAPLGFLILFGLIMGVGPLNLPAKIAEWFNQARESWDGSWNQVSMPRRGSGNSVFDEYQQTQMDRIDEIRAEIRNRDERFTSFKSDEQRDKERQQFDRFMGRDDQR